MKRFLIVATLVLLFATQIQAQQTSSFKYRSSVIQKDDGVDYQMYEKNGPGGEVTITDDENALYKVTINYIDKLDVFVKVKAMPEESTEAYDTYKATRPNGNVTYFLIGDESFTFGVGEYLITLFK